MGILIIGLMPMLNFGACNMPKNVTDMDKLRQSIEFMSKASKDYQVKVKDQLTKKEAIESPIQETTLPPQSLNGFTDPSG